MPVIIFIPGAIPTQRGGGGHGIVITPFGIERTGFPSQIESALTNSFEQDIISQDATILFKIGGETRFGLPFLRFIPQPPISPPGKRYDHHLIGHPTIFQAPPFISQNPPGPILGGPFGDVRHHWKHDFGRRGK